MECAGLTPREKRGNCMRQIRAGIRAMDMADWLASHSLGEYAPACVENRIDANVLPGMPDPDLRGLDIMALDNRNRLLTPSTPCT
jgi:hypothetical protein